MEIGSPRACVALGASQCVARAADATATALDRRAAHLAHSEERKEGGTQEGTSKSEGYGLLTALSHSQQELTYSRPETVEEWGTLY